VLEHAVEGRKKKKKAKLKKKMEHTGLLEHH
jgi:hypothetical protein